MGARIAVSVTLLVKPPGPGALSPGQQGPLAIERRSRGAAFDLPEVEIEAGQVGRIRVRYPGELFK